jgi:hypothetical protein
MSRKNTSPSAFEGEEVRTSRAGGTAFEAVLIFRVAHLSRGVTGGAFDFHLLIKAGCLGFDFEYLGGRSSASFEVAEGLIFLPVRGIEVTSFSVFEFIPALLGITLAQ